MSENIHKMILDRDVEISKLKDRLLVTDAENGILKAELKRIANLKNSKEMRVPLASSCPAHLATEDGFEPIHPMLKEGLRIAAKIAQEAIRQTEGGV